MGGCGWRWWRGGGPRGGAPFARDSGPRGWTDTTAEGLAAHDGVELLSQPDVFSYFRAFNELLARADALWSKPSELTFFAALGLPFIGAPPVGVHEEWNLRWAADRGAALKQHDPATAGEWLLEWVEDGLLAGAAEAGLKLPKMGLYEIAAEVRRAEAM